MSTKKRDCVRVVLSLGSNIDKAINLPKAVALLRERATVLAVSPVYETVPVGLLEQPNFWNCAVLIETADSPETIKQTLIADIETALLRKRVADKNAPRTIDIDIALYGNRTAPYLGRPLPDPDILRFAHVAAPVADLLPTEPHPETGAQLATIAAQLVEAANREQPIIWQVDVVV